jgi:D-erythronate 2-dehydrogenase
MKIVITGGGGFVGSVLAARLLSEGALVGPSGAREPIDTLVIADQAPTTHAAAPADARVEVAAGDVTDHAFLRSVIDREDTSVFHLASLVSGGCELDFDRALSVNVDGCRAVLDACRAIGSRPRVVFSSSSAVYGGPSVVGVVSDDTKPVPETTYGMTKAISELLVNDYTRKGFIDGRSARLPTVVIRPGRPNSAASSWVSGIFREPLNGEECIVPVDQTTRVPLAGHRSVAENLIRLHDADGDLLGVDRALNLPSLTVTASDIVAELRTVRDRALGPIRFRPDPFVTRIYEGWAAQLSFDRATALGLVRDDGLQTIVRAYLEDFVAGVGSA